MYRKYIIILSKSIIPALGFIEQNVAQNRSSVKYSKQECHLKGGIFVYKIIIIYLSE